MNLVDNGQRRELGRNGMKYSWMTVGEAYNYALERIEKIGTKNPALAAIWETEAAILKERLGSEE